MFGSFGPQILSNTDVLAQGSCNGFLTGKHYNRCKRIHSLLAVAVKIIHFRQYLKESGPLSPEMTDMLKALHINSSQQEVDRIEKSTPFVTLMEDYEGFTAKTRQGNRGDTAKYWMHYTDLVQLYRLFVRACKTNDVSLFTYALGRMRAVIFAANRPNYSRWMTLYHLNLLNVKEPFRTMLEDGELSIRRSAKKICTKRGGLDT